MNRQEQEQLANFGINVASGILTAVFAPLNAIDEETYTPQRAYLFSSAFMKPRQRKILQPWENGISEARRQDGGEPVSLIVNFWVRETSFDTGAPVSVLTPQDMFVFPDENGKPNRYFRTGVWDAPKNRWSSSWNKLNDIDKKDLPTDTKDVLLYVANVLHVKGLTSELTNYKVAGQPDVVEAPVSNQNVVVQSSRERKPSRLSPGHTALSVLPRRVAGRRDRFS